MRRQQPTDALASPPASSSSSEGHDQVASRLKPSCFRRIRATAMATSCPFMSMTPRPYSQPSAPST